MSQRSRSSFRTPSRVTNPDRDPPRAAELASHPAAAPFPLMGGAELQKLADDIRAHGLRQPITMLDGRILDGRNRFRACRIAGVEPRLKAFTGGDPIRYVLSQNIRRRHLTASQLAFVALGVEKLFAVAAKEKERRRKSGRDFPTNGNVELTHASRRAAAAVGVSHSYVERAKQLERAAPELAADVTAGTKTLPEAERIIAKIAASKASDDGWCELAEKRALLRAADEWERRRPSDAVPADVALRKLADFMQAGRERLERLPPAGLALLTRLHHEAQVMVQTMPNLADRQAVPALELLLHGRVCSNAGRKQLAGIVARLEDARERGINPDSVLGASYLTLDTPLRDGRNRDVERVLDGVFFELELANLDPMQRVLMGVEEGEP
jgi:hypothetical protein